MRPAKLILAFVLPCLMVRPAFGDGGVEPVGARFEEAKPPVSDASAVRIVDLYLAARGETAVRTFMLSGSVKEGLHEYRVTHYFQAPDKYRKEVSRENLGWQHRTVYASDGKIAWKQEQLPELKPAMTLEPDEMAEVEPEHWAYLLLSDWRDKGVVLEYVGEATTAGAPTYIVRANQGGRRVLYHFDQKLFLPRAIKYEDKVAGREVDLDHFPLRWLLVDGVRMESAYEVRNADQVFEHVEFDKVEVNRPLAADLFEMPRFREVWLHQLGRGEAQLEHRPELPEEE